MAPVREPFEQCSHGHYSIDLYDESPFIQQMGWWETQTIRPRMQLRPGNRREGLSQLRDGKSTQHIHTSGLEEVIPSAAVDRNLTGITALQEIYIKTKIETSRSK
ncbi:hypothetical protein CIHG_09547 [Coccidioides immitis H538.4]|uniref:Uncharacterized protein n=1 Tax=Coccidioides immitis H538.4 TaxID=396776 RepID=A0A0J8S2V8_COCIT|nr:hypothetical protein CIHG_09547 [Coccidioides immitis H538.4]